MDRTGFSRAAWSDLRPFSTGGTYLNFMSEDEGSERMGAALGKSLPRLAEIKAKWDPDNVFRTNRNIQPAQKAERDLEFVRPRRKVKQPMPHVARMR